MGRIPNWRRVNFIPEVTYFKPAGIPARDLNEVCLSVEEAEAIRLRDVEGLQQDDCAESMRISRPTFSRVLESARKKVADALINGKAVRIEGGDFEMAIRRFRCINGHEWDVPFETLIAAPPQSCPTCGTPNILPLQLPGFVPGGRRRGRGRWCRRVTCPGQQ